MGQFHFQNKNGLDPARLVRTEKLSTETFYTTNIPTDSPSGNSKSQWRDTASKSLCRDSSLPNYSTVYNKTYIL